MADYHFVTIWKVAAPVERVWDAILHAERFPQWWKSIQSVVELEKGGADGVGSVYRYTWVTKLPYKLEFDMKATRIEPMTRMEGKAFGELEGTGVWEFTPEGEGTRVTYTWDVKTTKAWMNLLAPIGRPFFAWNHNAVMQDGAVGLAKLLGVAVESVEE